MDNWKDKLKLRLPALILLAATVIFWSRYDRYENAGSLLLESPTMADATRVRGECAETNGGFVLTVPSSANATEDRPAGKSASLNFRMPGAETCEYIRVRGRIKVEDVVVGENYWRCARLLLIQYKANEKWIPGHHGVVAEEGTKGWEYHEDTFRIDPRAAHVDLVIQQTGLSGTAAFDKLAVEPIRIKASFNGWRIFFLVLWLLMALLYVPRCRLHRRKLRTLIALNALAILAGTLMPNAWIQDSAQRVKKTVQEFRASDTAPAKKAESPKEKPSTHPATLQKQTEWFMDVEVEAHVAGHFVLFATLCFLMYCSAALERQHPAYFFKVGADVMLFAAITESLQFLTFDRSAGLADLRIDLYGMAVALLAFVCMLPLIHRFSRSKADD